MPGRTSRGWSIRGRARRSRATGGLPRGALAPVLRKQVVKHVVDRHRAQQVVRVVDDGHRDEVVGRQVRRHFVERHIGTERVDVGVDHAGHERARPFAEHPLDVRDPEVLPGRCLRRRPAYVDLGRQRRGQLGVADPGKRLGDRRVRRQDHRLGRHHAAGGVLRVGEEASYRLCFVRFHQREQSLLLVRRQLGEQVGRVVRCHRLEHVRGTLALELGEDLDLVVLGQLLQHVGEPLVVERGGDLGAALLGQLVHDVREVGGAQLVERGEQVGGALRLLRLAEAGDLVPVECLQLSPAPEATASDAADRDARDEPVAGAALVHRHVDDGHRGAVLHHRDLAVEQLGDDERLARSAFEPAQVDAAADDDGVGVDRGHLSHGDEDPAPRLHLDRQAEHPRWLRTRAEHDDGVTNPAHLVGIGIEHRKAGQTGEKDTGGRTARHGPEVTAAGAAFRGAEPVGSGVVTNRRRGRASIYTLLLTCLATLLVAGACGGGENDNGIEKLSADKALAKVKAALDDVSTVHVTGQVNANGQSLDLDLRDKSGGGVGTIKVGGGRIDMVRLNGTIYVKGDAKALQTMGASSSQATLVAGKWLKHSATSQGGFAALASLLDTQALFANITSPQGTVKSGKVTTIDGKKAYTLIDAQDSGNGVLYIARTGEALPLRVDQPGTSGGTLSFDFGGSVNVKAPSGAVDLSQ